MKPKYAIIVIALAIVVTLPLYFYIPLYKMAKSVTNNASKLDIISSTDDYVEVTLDKSKLYAGTGAVLPMNRLIKVGPTQVFTDMKDATLMRFMPNSKFRIISVLESKYAIELLSGGFYFNRNPKGSFKGVKTAYGKITLLGTKGKITDSDVQLLEGEAMIDKSVKLTAKNGFKDTVKYHLDKLEQVDIENAMDSMKASEFKDFYKNMFDHLISFKRQLETNDSLELKDKTVEKKSDLIKKYVYDLLLNKIQVYSDMYVLRMAINSDRYSKEDLSFPKSLDSLSDDYAKRRLKDPWGNDYQYTSESGHFNLRSAGPDKEMNTPDDIVLFRARISANNNLLNL